MITAVNVGLASCVTCKRLIQETYNASFDEKGELQMHKVPAQAIFVKRVHDTDPTEFTEKEDGVTYHMCDLPLSPHHHHIPVQFKTCYDRGAWTWESKYNY
jgi:hypothetical protein